MNRQLTGLLAWGVLALIIGVPSAEVFFSRPADDAAPPSPTKDGTFVPDMEIIMSPPELAESGSSELPPIQETAGANAVDVMPETVPHDTGLSELLADTTPQELPEVTEPAAPAPSPVRIVGGTGLSIAAKGVVQAPQLDSDELDEPPLEMAAVNKPQVSAQPPMTTEMTLLPEPDAIVPAEVADEMMPDAPVPLPVPRPSYAVPAEPVIVADAPEQVPVNEALLVTAELAEGAASEPGYVASAIESAPVPMPVFMRPKPKTKSSARYVEVTKPDGITRPAAPTVYSTNIDGNSRFTANELRSRRQREQIARQLFADNPNRRFVTFNLPNGQRETIYRYGGWDEGRYEGQGQRLDTFENGEFYERDVVSENPFSILNGGWSRFTSSGGSFTEQLPAQRGNGVRLDLVN